MKTVSESALIRRINRRLDGEKLRKYSGGRNWLNLGDYYLTDDLTNGVLSTHVCLDTLGRELDALGAGEVVG